MVHCKPRVLDMEESAMGRRRVSQQKDVFVSMDHVHVCKYKYIYICINLYIQDSFHTNQRFQETELCKQSSSMCHPPASSYDSSKLAWKIEEKHYIWPPFVFFHGINMIENQAQMYCNPWGLRHHHELDHGGHQQTHDSHQLFPITAKH